MRYTLKFCVVAVTLLGCVAAGYCDDGGGDRSLRKALLYSLVLPGAGQHYLGNHGRARMMYVAEAGVWTAFAGYRIQGGMRKDKYKEMARLFAGVGGDIADDYAIALAYYGSNEDYNIDVMREARYLYPDDKEDQLAYFDANGYFGTSAWEWESAEKRDEFAKTRTLSRGSYRHAVLTTGFAVLNRVVSMIDIYLTFRLADRGERSSYPSLRVEKRAQDSYRFYLSTSF
ncbi:MAG: hypothetical protein ABIJ00_06365 [Candidatus Eisenbacteria bacterium]